MLDHPDFTAAEAHIDSLVASADRWRLGFRRRDNRRSVAAGQFVSDQGRTLAAALDAFGDVVADVPAADGRTRLAMRSFVVDALAIARSVRRPAGTTAIADLPASPGLDAPAIVIARTAGVLARRTAGGVVVLDPRDAERLGRRLAAIRVAVAFDQREVVHMAPAATSSTESRVTSAAA